MRYLFLVLVFVSSFAYAEITKEEEIYLKNQYTYEQLLKQRNNLIVERDALLVAEDVKCQSAKQVIIDTYEPQINAIETQVTNVGK